MQKTILAILLICCLPTHAIAQTSYEELSQISEPTSKKLLLPLIFLTDDNFSEDEKWVEYFAYSVFDTRCGDGERINSLVTRPAGWPKKAVIKADFESLDVFPATAEIGEELVSRMTVRTGQTDRRISIQLIVRVDPQTIDINQDEEQIDLQGKIVAARILSADNSWALPGLTPLGDYPAFTE